MNPHTNAKLNYQKAIPGTIIDGSTGTVIADSGRIIGDFIEFPCGEFYASPCDSDRGLSGSESEIIQFLIVEQNR